MSRPEDDLERLGRAIGALEPPRPSPVARARMRARINSAPATTTPGRATPAPARVFAFLRPLQVAVSAAVATIVLMLVAMNAANASLPGDHAYAIKVALDRADVLIDPDPVARVGSSERVMDRRLSDLVTVATLGASRASAATRAYAEAIDDLVVGLERARDRLDDAERRRTLAEVDAICERHERVLDDLARQGVDVSAAIDKVRDLDARAQRALGLRVDAGPDTETPRPRPSTTDSTRTAAPTARPADGRGPNTGPGGGGETRTAEPLRNVEPARTPEPTRTAQPAEAPRAIETAHPSDTPQPIRTAQPTDTPRPIATAGPASTPRASESPGSGR